MTLLAAFKTLLYKYAAQEDIVVGTAIANRNLSEIEPLIGFFVNMLPLRTDLSGNPRFSELLKRVKEVALDAYVYQDVPFEQLVKKIRPERAAWGMPLFNVLFGVQNAPRTELKLDGAKIMPIPVAQEMVRFDLAMWVTESGDEVQVDWTYRKCLFEERTIIRMHDHLETLLFAIVDRPEIRLNTIAMVSRKVGNQDSFAAEAPRPMRRRRG